MSQQPVVVLGVPWTLGSFIAVLVILAAFVLAVVGQLDPKLAGFFIALGFARLL